MTEQAEHRAPGLYLTSGDWNTTVIRDGLSLDEVYDVIDSFDEVFERAIGGLAATEQAVSTQEEKEGETDG